MGGNSSLGGDDNQEEDQEDKFPFGVPGEEASVGVTYATAEGEMSTDERRKSMIFADREGTSSSTITLQIKKGRGNKGKAKGPIVPVRGILKSPPSHLFFP